MIEDSDVGFGLPDFRGLTMDTTIEKDKTSHRFYSDQQNGPRFTC